jgi:predicted kinase
MAGNDPWADFNVDSSAPKPDDPWAEFSVDPVGVPEVGGPGAGRAPSPGAMDPAGTAVPAGAKAEPNGSGAKTPDPWSEFQMDPTESAPKAKEPEAAIEFPTSEVPKPEAKKTPERSWGDVLDFMGDAFRRGSNQADQYWSLYGADKVATDLDALNQSEARVTSGKKAPLNTVTEAGARDFAYDLLTPEERGNLRAKNTEALTKAFQNIADARAKLDKIPPAPPEVTEAMQAKTFGEFWDKFKQAPVTFIATVGAESLPASSVGIGGGIVGGVTGGVPGAMAGAGAGSYSVDYMSQILGGMEEAGVDITNPEAMAKAIADPAMMGKIKEAAEKHAIGVGAFDALSAGVASKLLLPSALVKARPVVGHTANVAVQAPVQGTLGAAGEVAGSGLAGQEIKPGDVGAEFFGEFMTAPAEVVGIRSSVNAEREKAKLTPPPIPKPGADASGRVEPTFDDDPWAEFKMDEPADLPAGAVPADTLYPEPEDREKDPPIPVAPQQQPPPLPSPMPGEGMAADEPSAEPLKDLMAQAADLADPANPRQGLWLPKASYDELRKDRPAFGEVLKSGVRIADFDGQGGMLVVPNERIKAWAIEQRDAGFPVQGIVGALTGSGRGKPADGTQVVQQRTADGAVTRESLVRQGEVDQTAQEFAAPGRSVEVLTPEQVVQRRAVETGMPPPIPQGSQAPPPIPQAPSSADVDAKTQAQIEREEEHLVKLHDDMQTWVKSAGRQQKYVDQLEEIDRRIAGYRSGKYDEHRTPFGRAFDRLLGVDPQPERNLRAEKLESKRDVIRKDAELTQQRFDEMARAARDSMARLEALKAKFPQLPPPIPQTSDDLARAVAHVREPSEAQREAGNYPKGHIKVQGLDISVETPKGGVRKGKGWQVQMPAHYGYFRGVPARAKDKEHVDVYVGDNPQSARIWIVDQYDLESGKFDEPKVIMGTESEWDALDLYDAGFSDGKGPQRRRSAIEVTPDELSMWLESGDATQPFSKSPFRPAESKIGEDGIERRRDPLGMLWERRPGTDSWSQAKDDPDARTRTQDRGEQREPPVQRKRGNFYATVEEATEAAKSGKLASIPHREHRCYEFAGYEAREGVGRYYVIGKVGKGIYHAVAMNSDRSEIYDPQYGAWFPTEVYSKLVNGWTEETVMTGREADEFGHKIGKWPSPSVLAQAIAEGKWRTPTAPDSLVKEQEDRSHLDALETRLSHEREYLRAAKTDQERDLRKVWISQLQKEIADERKHIGLTDEDPLPEMSDDELLAELDPDNKPAKDVEGSSAKASESEAGKADEKAAKDAAKLGLNKRRRITTPDGSMEIEAVPEIVELATLKRASGNLQPRDRSRDEAIVGVRERAAKLDPEQLMPARVSDTGSPIVLADGTVISGNGRVMSIAEVYKGKALQAQADKYRQALGPAAEGMTRPVLIMRAKGLSPEAQERFADLSNRSRIAAMSATERALRDAKAMGDSMGLYEGGEYTSPKNRAFFRAFMDKAVSSSERGSVSKDGELTKEGQDRITAALLSAAYGDADLLAVMLESTDDNIRNFSAAMRDAAGSFVRLKADVEAGIVPKKFDVTGDITEAVRLIADLRRRGVKPAEHLAQQDAFNKMKPVTEMFIRAFFNDEMTRANRLQITEVLTQYAEEASKKREGGFLEDDTRPEDIVRQGRERRVREAGGLFAGEAVREDAREDREEVPEPGTDRRRVEDDEPDAVDGASEDEFVEALIDEDLPALAADVDQAMADLGYENELTDDDVRALARIMVEEGVSAEDAINSYFEEDGVIDEEPDLEESQAAVGSMAGREAAARRAMTAPAWLKASTTTDARETAKAPGFGSLEWQQKRQYQTEDGKPIQGVSAALDHIIKMAVDKLPTGLARQHRAYIIVGYPGSGKSTMSEPVSERYRAAHMTADDAKFVIPEYDNGRNTQDVHVESAHLIALATKRLLERGDNVVIETVGSNRNSIEGRTKILRQYGYEIALISVEVPKTVAMERAVSRFKKTGRAVPAALYDGTSPGDTYARAKQEDNFSGVAQIRWDDEAGKWDLVEAEGSLRALADTLGKGKAGGARLEGRGRVGGTQGAPDVEQAALGPVKGDDYRGEHEAPDREGGAPISDVSANGIYPDDFYGPNGRRYYAPEDGDASAFAKVHRLRGKPDEKVAVYRAIPAVKGKPKGLTLNSQHIRPGDWVSISRAYAVEHGESALNGDYHLAKRVVLARDLFTDGNSIQEWGWDPEVADEQAALGLGPKLNMTKEARYARAREQGFDTSTVWYHGSGRVDRLTEKGKLDPKRATSGPMPFFTDDPQMASNYATSKNDTSLAQDDEGASVVPYFTVSPKAFGHSGRTPYTVEQSWNYLTPEQRSTIAERATRVGYSNWPEDSSGDIILHPEGTDASLSSSHYADLLRGARGNHLRALREIWHDAGSLVGEEDQLAHIYRLAGYPHPISQATAPWTRAEGVMPVFLRMRNPLVSDDKETISKIIPQLEELLKRDRSRLPEYSASDTWDKRSRWTPKEWVQQLKEDTAREGARGSESFVWTSIPDKITAALRQLGYDGILDRGGKSGGQGHSVAVPFSANQVRSINAAFSPTKMGDDQFMSALSEDNAMSRDDRRRLEIEDKLSRGKVAKLPELIAKRVHKALAQDMGTVPTDVDVGVVTKIAPFSSFGVNTGVRIEMVTADGRTLTRDARWDGFKESRARTFNSGGRPTIAFFTLDLARQTDESLRGQLRHEVFHVLRNKGLINDAVFDRLVRHSDDLGVLEFGLKDYLDFIGFKTDESVSSISLRKLYERNYAGVAAFQEVMNQEAGAHFVELAATGKLSEEMTAPVQDILDDIQSGRLARGDAPAEVGVAAALGSRSPLNMTKAARMKRAKEQGFDTSKVWYHGTTRWDLEDGRSLGDITAFDRMAAVKNVRKPVGMDTVGHWFSDLPGREGASMYAGNTGAVYPVYLKITNPWRPASFDEFLDKMHETAGRDPKTQKPRGVGSTDELRTWLKKNGYDGIFFSKGTTDGNDQSVTVVLEPDQVRSVNAAFDPALENEADILSAIRGFHGSPFVFTPEPGAPAGRFRMDFIGKGEGAQAFGRGLYFTESEKLAQHYQRALSKRATGDGIHLAIDGQRVDNPAAREILQAEMDLHDLADDGGDWKVGTSAFIEPGMAEQIEGQWQGHVFRQAAKNKPDDQFLQYLEKGIEFLRQIAGKTVSVNEGAQVDGRLYEVSLDVDENHLLLWDQPLSKQPGPVRHALRKGLGSELGADWLSTLKKALSFGKDNVDHFGVKDPNSAGAYVAKGLKTRGGESVTEALQRFGIQGIKYLDASSRKIGDGTYNYVVFDESKIEIVAVDGDPVPVAQRDGLMSDIQAALGPTAGRSMKETDHLGFYSPALEKAKAWGQSKGTVEQLRRHLNADKELAAIGFDKAFPDPKAGIFKEEAVKWLRANRVELGETRYGDGRVYDVLDENDNVVRSFSSRADAERFAATDDDFVINYDEPGTGEARFSGYSTPGGIPGSYREVVTTIPVRKPEVVSFEDYWRQTHVSDLSAASPQVIEIARQQYAQFAKNLPDPGVYTSTHWPGVTNPLLHYRIKDFEAPIDPVLSRLDAEAAARDKARIEDLRRVSAPGQATSIPPEVHIEDIDISDIAHLPAVRQEDILLSRLARANKERNQLLNPTKAIEELAKPRPKIRVLDELQSDWAQSYRDKGGKDPAALAALKEQHTAAIAARNALEADMRAELADLGPEWTGFKAKEAMIRQKMMREQLSERAAAGNDAAAQMVRNWDLRHNETLDLSRKMTAAEEGVPSGPFISNTSDWVDLGLKQVLADAARDPSVNRLAWTPGDVQAQRYNMERVANRFRYDPENNTLDAFLDNGPNQLGDNIVTSMTAKPEELPGIIGQDVADALLASPATHGRRGRQHQIVLYGDKKFGGEGHKSFYGYYGKDGKFVPGIVSRRLLALVQRLDPEAARLEPTHVSNKDGWHITPPEGTTHGKWMVKSSDYNSTGLRFETEAEARAALAEKIREGGAYPSISITPALREKILSEGLPMFGNVGGDRKFAAILSQAERKEIAGKIEDAIEIVQRIAGPRVEVAFYEEIPNSELMSPEEIADLKRQGFSVPDTLGGFYDRAGSRGRAEAFIALATADRNFDLLTSAGHEAWHHVKEALATPAEKKLLAAPSEQARMRREAAAQLGIDPNSQEAMALPDYEVEALAFERFRKQREEDERFYSPLHIGIRRFFDRVWRILRAVENVVRGLPADSYEAIFERARTGEIARERAGSFEPRDSGAVTDPDAQAEASQDRMGSALSGGAFSRALTSFRDRWKAFTLNRRYPHETDEYAREMVRVASSEFWRENALGENLLPMPGDAEAMTQRAANTDDASGYQRAFERQKLERAGTAPFSVATTREQDLERFFDEMVEVEPGTATSAFKLYEAYALWAERNGRDAASLADFNRFVAGLGLVRMKGPQPKPFRNAADQWVVTGKGIIDGEPVQQSMSFPTKAMAQEFAAQFSGVRFVGIRLKKPDRMYSAIPNNWKDAEQFADAPRDESAYIDEVAYKRSIRATYVDADGNVRASSRTVPVPTSVDLPPVGTWRISPIKGLYGREIDKLVRVPVDTLEIPEVSLDGKLDPTKRGDDERYADWLQQGMRAPPIDVVQTERGGLRVMDGHRRVLGAKRAGQTEIEAWVSPTVPAPHGRVASDGRPIMTGLTFEMVRDRHDRMFSAIPLAEVWGPKFQKMMSREYQVAVEGYDYSTQYDILAAKYNNDPALAPDMKAAIRSELIRLEGEMGPDGMAAAGIKGLASMRPEWMNDILAPREAAKVELQGPFDAVMSGARSGLILQNGSRSVALSKSLDPEYAWRLTDIDENGPAGHREYRANDPSLLSDLAGYGVRGFTVRDARPDRMYTAFPNNLGGPTQQQRQSLLNRLIPRAPLDRLIRVPFDIFGGTNETGQWVPGLKLSKGAAHLITSAKFSDTGRFRWVNEIMHKARAGLVDRYGLDPAYVERERQRGLDERRIMAEVPELMATLRDANVGAPEARALQAILTGEQIPDKEWAKLSNPIRNSIDQYGQEAVNLGLLSAEVYERNKGTYLHRVYRKHEVDQHGLSRLANQIMGSRRQKIIGNEFKGRGLFTEAVESKLDGAVKGDKFVILDKTETDADGKTKTTSRVYVRTGNPIPAEYAGYTNRGTWEVRGKKSGKIVLWRDFTKDERMKMGEIVDARYTIAKTYMLLAHDLAVGRFYKDISQNADWAQQDEPAGKWVNASEFSRFWSDSALEWVRVPDTKIPKSDTLRYGALAGMYVRAEIWRDLNELQKMQAPNTWNALLTQWKLNKTARSPVVHMNNIMSNAVLMDMADVHARDFIRAVREMAKDGPLYKEANENGAFGSDMIALEIRRDILQPILEEIEKGETNAGTLGNMNVIGKILGAVWDKVKAADRAMVNLYQMEDEIFRMATYIRRRQQGLSATEAAIEARDQFLNYDIRAPLINAARRSVLPFISYTYRAVPILAHTIMTRPWKLAKYAAVAYAVNALAYAIAPGDDDEDKERRSLRESEQGNTWIGAPRMLRLPYIDANGNPVFLDVRRWIPAGDIFDVSMGSPAVGLPSWIQPGGPLMLGAELMLNKQAFTGKEITNDLTDDWWDKTKKVGDWAWKSWVPSAAWIPGSWYWQKIGDAIDGARDWSGRPYSVPQAVSSSFGVKLKPQDVDEGFKVWGFEFDKIERALNDEVRRNRKDKKRGLISESEYDAAMERIREKKRNMKKRKREVFHGAEE